MKANNSDGSSGLASSAAPSSKQKRKQMRKQKQEQFAREQEQMQHKQDKDDQGKAVGKMCTVQTVDYSRSCPFSVCYILCTTLGNLYTDGGR